MSNTNNNGSKLRLRAVLPFVFVFLILGTSLAAAFCGPGFSSKSTATSYYQTSEGKARVPVMTTWLRARGFMEKDQSFDSFIKSDKVAYIVTPKGYRLKANTMCPSPGSIRPYNGLYEHSQRGVLAKKVKEIKKGGKVKKHKVGQTTTYTQTITIFTSWRPFMKDYCRNLVDGKPFVKKKTIIKRWTKRGPPPVSVPTTPSTPACGPNLVWNGAACVTQTNTTTVSQDAKQQCEANVKGTWNGSMCVIIQNTTVSMMGRKSTTSMEATEVKKGAIGADVFATPAGYKKVDSPLKKMGRMGGR